jgi:hypothetical protein
MFQKQEPNPQREIMKYVKIFASVADPVPGSRIRCFFTLLIRDLDAGYFFSGSQISDPESLLRLKIQFRFLKS